MRNKQGGQDQIILGHHRHLHAVLGIHHGGKAQPHAVGDHLTAKHQCSKDHLQNETHADSDQDLLQHDPETLMTEHVDGRL